MDLRQRGGRDRHWSKRVNICAERTSKFPLDLLTDRVERLRRYAILQARQRRDPFVRQNIGARRDKLAGLDQQSFEPNRGAIERPRRAQILTPIALLLALARWLCATIIGSPCTAYKSVARAMRRSVKR